MLLTIILCAIIATSDTAKYRFGFRRGNPSGSWFTVTLYIYPNIYQCKIRPYSKILNTCDVTTPSYKECATSSSSFDNAQYGMQVDKDDTNKDSVQIVSLYIENVLTGEITIITLSNGNEWVGYHDPNKIYNKLFPFSSAPDGTEQSTTGIAAVTDDICNTKNPSFHPTKQPTSAPTDPTPFCTLPPCITDIALDIAFLIDDSGSVNDDEFKVMIDFIKHLIVRDINAVSYVSLYSYSDMTDFKQLADFTEKDVVGEAYLLNVLTNHNRDAGYTYTGDAIKKTLGYFDAYPSNDRLDLLFVLTDGVSYDIVCDVVSVSDIGNVEIVLVGVGEEIDIQILSNQNYNCLYDNVAKDVFYIDQFSEQSFNEKEYELRLRMCLTAETLPAEGTALINYRLLFIISAILFTISLNFNLCFVCARLNASKKILYSKVNQIKNEKNIDY